MATKKTNNMYNLSGFARVYVKNGQAYGVCLCGTQEVNGEKKYVNLWKKVDDGNITITTNKRGCPVVHIRMIDIETVNKTDNADASYKEEDGHGPEADKQRKAVAAEEAKEKGKKKSSGWGGLEPADGENLPF